MFSTAGRLRVQNAVIFTVSAALALTSVLHAQGATPPLFRLFLKDGTALISYGEFARLSDRVVFSVPMGEGASMKLQMISVPERSVDWQRTDEYAAAIRARRYAETQGEHDFVALTGQVSAALNEIALAPDPKRRVAMAEEARRNLAAWPAANHGYRASDVAQLVGMLDDVVAEMRIAAGESQFDLSLVATVTPVPAVPLLPAPGVRVTLEAAYQAALMAEPSERIALLRTLTQELDYAPPSATWAPVLKVRAHAALLAEMRIDNAYAELGRQTLADAQKRSARADVRGLQEVVAQVLAADARLGSKRPGELTSLLATLDLRLDEARRLRLARDAWTARLEVFRDYHAAVRTPQERLTRLRGPLTDIRELSGPDAATLRKVDDYATMAERELAAIVPPPELKATHDLFVASIHMTRQAAALRRSAISSNTLKLAWDAAAAASGAMLLSDQAGAELDRILNSTEKRQDKEPIR